MPLTNYSYLRAVEIEGRHPADAGAWQITVHRLSVGEGLPQPLDPQFEVEHPASDLLPPAPRLPSSRLNATRPIYYRQLRSPIDCERYFDSRSGIPSVGVSLPLTLGWLNPPNGIIPMPQAGESTLEITHHVSIKRCFAQRGQFLFQNWWGDWGDHGMGYLPYEYFERFVFESWASYYRPHLLQPPKETPDDGFRAIRWTTDDEWSHRVYGFEIRAAQSDTRFGWAFAIEIDGILEIEELYVRPEFRGQGYGRKLAESLAELGRARSLPIRLWVPFADCTREAPQNAGPLVAVTRRIGLTFRPCPVRWAAYLASNEVSGASSPVPLEPDWIPQRPRSALHMLQAAVCALGISTNGTAPAISSAPPAIMQHDFPTIGTEAWGQMNRRRAELIRKKNRQGLTVEERSEYERLQTLASAALQAVFPKPSLAEEKLDELEKRLQAEATKE